MYLPIVLAHLTTDNTSDLSEIEWVENTEEREIAMVTWGEKQIKALLYCAINKNRSPNTSNDYLQVAIYTGSHCQIAY
jgi:hypothetical protein